MDVRSEELFDSAAFLLSVGLGRRIVELDRGESFFAQVERSFSEWETSHALTSFPRRFFRRRVAGEREWSARSDSDGGGSMHSTQDQEGRHASSDASGA